MIVSGGQTIRRPFQEQLPADYMEPLNFSFTLEGNGFGENVDFGLNDASNNKLINYSLRSGIVYDYSGRNVGTYQSGINKFQYFFKDNKSWQKINDRLISLGDEYGNYSGNPFRKFFIANNSISDIDFDLNINGFAPPTEFTNLGTSDLITLNGKISQSGLADHPGQEVYYQLFNISVPPQYGTVTFPNDGLGEIDYTIAGGSYTFSDIIPVTFDTYFGEFTYNLAITGTTASPDVSGEQGVYLSLYGIDNLVPFGGTLDFNLDYYSNQETPVKIELEVVSGSTTAVLSGETTGTITYSSYVVGGKNIQSNVTGIIDLFDPINAAYNTQYQLIDRYITLSDQTQFSKFLYFTGSYTEVIENVLLTGIYAGPRADMIGGRYACRGTLYVQHTFIESEQGFYHYEGIATGIPVNNSVSYPSWLWQRPDEIPNGPWGVYPSNSTYFPQIVGVSGYGTGYVNIDITGEGFVSLTENYSILGSGTGRVGNNSTYISVNEATGNLVYTGNAQNGFSYSSYPYDKPVITPASAGGILYQLFGDHYEGTADYNGELIPVEGPADPNEFTWGYASGPSFITLNPIDGYTTRFLSLASVTGQNSTGGIVSQGFTGIATGLVNGNSVTIQGPTFGAPQFTSMSSFTGGFGLNPVSGASYGRSEMRSDFYYTYADVGFPNYYPNVIYQINQPNFAATVEMPMTGYQRIYIRNIQPRGIGTAQTYLEFPNMMTVSQTGYVFSGSGEVSASGVVGNFNLLESVDEFSTPINYIAAGWISGDTLVKPYIENFPADSASRYLRVEYLNANPNSIATAILRVTGGQTLQEIYITGNSDGIRY